MPRPRKNEEIQNQNQNKTKRKKNTELKPNVNSYSKKKQKTEQKTKGQIKGKPIKKSNDPKKRNKKTQLNMEGGGLTDAFTGVTNFFTGAKEKIKNLNQNILDYIKRTSYDKIMNIYIYNIIQTLFTEFYVFLEWKDDELDNLFKNIMKILVLEESYSKIIKSHPEFFYQLKSFIDRILRFLILFLYSILQELFKKFLFSILGKPKEILNIFPNIPIEILNIITDKIKTSEQNNTIRTNSPTNSNNQWQWQTHVISIKDVRYIIYIFERFYKTFRPAIFSKSTSNLASITTSFKLFNSFENIEIFPQESNDSMFKLFFDELNICFQSINKTYNELKNSFKSIIKTHYELLILFENPKQIMNNLRNHIKIEYTLKVILQILSWISNYLKNKYNKLIQFLSTNDDEKKKMKKFILEYRGKWNNWNQNDHRDKYALRQKIDEGMDFLEKLLQARQNMKRISHSINFNDVDNFEMNIIKNKVEKLEGLKDVEENILLMSDTLKEEIRFLQNNGLY